ncbi:murein transglycosylase [Jannaschia pagri]|uniref:Murein transglycosylase n=1 Tax=Jannaschia pagri TaxID=2829797 RepID=A0ABQ4NKP5_9RHOB|nr:MULTISPECIES: lytic murein transglycosylase [unclassified Jannaschia]GIT90968.1 murein transglycosylase [Jannaschia sp. AI_61]GIT94800.1 murein transglycosylase [Jannaschia sp. AI_62]
MGRVIAGILGASLALWPMASGADAPQSSDRPVARTATPPVSDMAAWLTAFRPRALAAGISDDTYDRALANVSYQPDIVRLDRNQSEFTKTIWEYLDTAVSAARVRNGQAALARYGQQLDRIEARYGVPKEIIVAIWGLESSYGAVRGNTPTIQSIATLAFDGRRADLWEGELLAVLQIVEAREAAPATLRGSWAGAMGHTQFLPTSYLAHAQDWDDNGRRDIWGDDPLDALASTGAYLAHFGWTTGQPWGVEVRLPDGFDYRLTGELVTKTAEAWAALGVRPVGGGSLPPGDGVSIRVPGGHTGAAFATYPNFRVLESYNTADAYVIGVGHLADRLAGGPPIQGGWPEGDRALTFAERVEMQRLLAAKGFDPKKFDGLVGPLTLEAIQQYQQATGQIPDGYANPALLRGLR